MFVLLHTAKRYRAQQRRQSPLSLLGSVPEVCRGFFEICHVAAIIVQPEEADVAEEKGVNWYDSEKESLLIRNYAEAS